MAPLLHPKRFPGESSAYREARNGLLQAEIALRRNIEEVAALRRTLPLSGEVPEDYIFDEGAADLKDSATTHKTRLSELFQSGKDTLAIYSFMYGPKMKAACPSCTSIVDSLDGTTPHATQRINLAVVARNPLEKIRAHARSRGWRNLRLLSSANNTYNRDYHGENPEGDQMPGLNVFTRRDGKIHHFYYTELRFVPPDPGQNERHVDMFWPLWNLFDYTPEGRGKDWYPKLVYP
ncbi:MAG TPA: DUF899 family protein [Terriglobales bacterium]|nr:DUF899 family protein [Terriglobales bacterium]